MAMTDPIADMLTRMRNALSSGRRSVEMPASRMKEGILRVLQSEGYIDAYDVIEAGVRTSLRVHLKHNLQGEAAIHELKRESRPGQRRYLGCADLPRVREGVGIAVVSTSQGVLSDRACREKHVGGEVLCTLW